MSDLLDRIIRYCLRRTDLFNSYLNNFQPLISLIRRMELYYILRHGRWLFDVDFYLSSYTDVAESGIDPIRHYVFHGASENRNPHLLFDNDYYIRIHRYRYSIISPLSHFLLIGSARRLSPTVFFDYQLYLRANTDVAALAIDPYRHFIEHGIYENRTSTQLFDPGFYLRSNPDVEANGIPALLHYLLFGEREGRLPIAPHLENSLMFSAAESEPRDAFREILAIRKRRRNKTLPAYDTVDIIMPVYRGYEETLSAISHVLRSKCVTPFELIVIDDCSPDPALSAALAKLAPGRFTLIVNDRNRGFVYSVNRGMSANTNRDVVLLNSDTEVYGDWLDRLRRHAKSRNDVGTVTPLTNSGTICSYPHFVRDNLHPLEIKYEEIDQIASTVNTGKSVEAPTAVGFCMYIKRSAINDVGLFDEDAFGTGYGEENDFCLRAQAIGYVDLIAGDVFVRHLGSTSFGMEKYERIKNAIRVINERYPSYSGDVRNFIKRDPVLAFRQPIDIRRLKAKSGKKNVLIISHSRGGGTEQQINEDAIRYSADDVSVFRMRAAIGNPFTVDHFHVNCGDLPNFPHFQLSSQQADIVKLWNDLRIDEIHVHHLVEFSGASFDEITSLLLNSNRRFIFHIHDYHSICPRIHLSGSENFYCGEPGVLECQKCLRQRPSPGFHTDITEWRSRYQKLLVAAAAVVVPDPDVAERVERYFPGLRLVVEPHDPPEAEKPISSPTPATSASSKRIGLLGAISQIKGFNVLCAVATDARERNLGM